jgi:hypothetical protein
MDLYGRGLILTGRNPDRLQHAALVGAVRSDWPLA